METGFTVTLRAELIPKKRFPHQQCPIKGIYTSIHVWKCLNAAAKQKSLLGWTLYMLKLFCWSHPGLLRVCVCITDLVAIDHEMVSGDEGFEHDHPAGVGGALEQRVSQLRDVYIHLICALNQIWGDRDTNVLPNQLLYSTWLPIMRGAQVY